MRLIAVDWSGAVRGARQKIWLAEWSDGAVRRVENGRTREELANHLVELKARDPELIVGFDFAFSLPSWFVQHCGFSDAPSFWPQAASEVEVWLRHCEAPFWGRAGTTCQRLGEGFRLTDRTVPSTKGIAPKSVFQVGGAGAVGTGSLRGLAVLHRLREAGFAIWPFDDSAHPRTIEIYPRVLTGPVVKANPASRRDYLSTRYGELGTTVMAAAVSSEDAFDAVVSVLVMAVHCEELVSLRASQNAQIRREGWIWFPGTSIPS